MSLILKIILFKGQPFNAGTEAFFDRHGGTIGRADENTLVLPDPEKFVSRRHASISFEQGHYLIKDSSLSGTYIDDQESPLNHAEQRLVNGTRLRMGEYEILVSIEPEQQMDEPTFGPDLFSSSLEEIPAAGNLTDDPLNPFASAEVIFNSSPHDDPHLNSLLHDTSAKSFLAADGLLHLGQDKEQPDFESLMQSKISPIRDSFIPPVPIMAAQSGNEIPDDFNFEDLFNFGTDAPTDDHDNIQNIEAQAVEDLSLVMAEAKPVPETVNSQFKEPETPLFNDRIPISEVSVPDVQKIPVQGQFVGQAAVSNELFHVFLQGAGLKNKDLRAQAAPETMHRIGLMFRKLVEGTVAVLRSRAEFKSHFRISVTTLKTTDNNPLKFTVTTEEALTHLLKNGKGPFKDSAEAIDEGFNDIMSHQMAMQAGIQASMAQILKQFDPKLIDKQFEEGLVLQKKSKCWDKYSALYPSLVEQALENFFGDAFADAYEKQMKQLSKLRTDKK